MRTEQRKSDERLAEWAAKLGVTPEELRSVAFGGMERRRPAGAAPRGRKQRLLFVCVQNSSRSQMAEALANRLAPGEVEAVSAGIDPGCEINPNAVRTMRELGIDISLQRCKHVSEFRKVKFDFVAKMDVAHLGESVQARWIETWDIPDPAQGELDEFRAVRDMLALRVRRALETRLGAAPAPRQEKPA